MFLSIFEVFKIGIGPSSSHTMGPMVAAERFLHALKRDNIDATHLRCSLHGSLAFTGKGHRTDQAVILGLDGFTPPEFNASLAKQAEARIATQKAVRPKGHPVYRFDPATDVVFDYDRILEDHANGMILQALKDGNVLHEQIYYSIGGGFVQTPEELAADTDPTARKQKVLYPFRSAKEMLAMAKASGKTIAQLKWANETIHITPAELNAGILKIWSVMNECIDAGFNEEGILPGGLNTRRRAKGIHDELQDERGNNMAAPHIINDWIASYAMSVNEQNAAGARVVTAPTNGAAGVIPATLRYYLDHVPGADPGKIIDFLLTASAIGALIKSNASISGAEVGCQGEVGSAAAMAAAGLCAVLGGTNEQIENAAEIALEHHLGMTCDPIKGLVQAPCIERNGLGAIKAVSAASLSLRGDGKHLVSLDACIETMRQTGLDMNSKYKETSLGGLAVNLPAC
ncbi:MAG: L-serine ammonia-lyase [Proteobacteria bacterium]|nr:L-serine ammonia-lyase [Pseudomonadota bacterium]